HHTLAVIRVRLAVVVPHVRKVLALDTEADRVVVVTDSEQDVASMPNASNPTRGPRLEREARGEICRRARGDRRVFLLDSSERTRRAQRVRRLNVGVDFRTDR